jgi:hypothetical protein
VHRGTCELHGSHTILHSPRGRVFAATDRGRTSYYACAFNAPSHVLLQRGGSFRRPALTRPYVAWVSGRSIHRMRLTGGTMRDIRVNGAAVRALVVTRDGWVSWIQERAGRVFEVWRFDSRGRKLMDHGDVNASSLCRLGSRVSWTHRDGRPRYDACDFAGERTAFMR